jgi:hypothetical protein
MNSFEIAREQWEGLKPLIEKFIRDVESKIQYLENIGSPKIID